MKICPKCQKTYSDDNLNFCLDDGAVLSQAGSNAPQQEDKLPETVMMSTPRPTNPNQPVNNPPPPTWGHQQQQSQSQPNWGATPTYQTPQAQAQPKSKSWMWVVGILAAVVLVCGGGGIGLIALVANMEPTDSGNTNRTIANTDTTKSPEKDSGSKFEKIDLSGWTKTNPAYATSEYKNGEFIMGTKEKGYYYVLVAGVLYQTEDATTRVTVRNVEEKPSRLGYGLIFHSNPTPLTQDYGFLIDADKQRYRVVKHLPKTETDVIKWTKSTVIKNGTQKNVLEVKDSDGEITLFINGQKIESFKNKDGYSGGVPGVYSGDGIPVAFSDLEVGK